MIFSNAFSWVKKYQFWFQFHWNLFIRANCWYVSFCSVNGFVRRRPQVIILANDDLVCWCIYASLGINELSDNHQKQENPQCNMHYLNTLRIPFQYPIRRLIVRSYEVSQPPDLYLELSYRSAIWQAQRQYCCRRACQISKRCNNSNCQSRGFETSRDLTMKRLIWYWSWTQVVL